MSKLTNLHRFYSKNWNDFTLRKKILHSFKIGENDFITDFLPADLFNITVEELFNILREKFGESIDLAVHEAYTEVGNLHSNFPKELLSPVSKEKSGNWIKKANIVGINVRTIKSFWNILNYTLSLPKSQNCLHLLPIWEPGVVGSLYGISSWNINREFFNRELEDFFPYLDTSAKQLKATINILHVMGFTVGMDVIPHTDRFSEIVIANPHFFEWLQRKDTEIVDHSEFLHLKVQNTIFNHLMTIGPTDESINIPNTAEQFFSNKFSEEKRILALFGQSDDFYKRLNRRVDIIKSLHENGFETVPATMGPPYRGLKVDTSDEGLFTDINGLTWRDYLFINPTETSRVFGPLTRYKLFRSINNNKKWEIDFQKPIIEVWNYVCKKYFEIQNKFNFDFMRGDMSHVQMRPNGVPIKIDEYYDLLRSVKRFISLEMKKSYFSYFAESFLAPDDYMAYGSEIDHLEASEAEITLGNLQSTVFGSIKFHQKFSEYLDILKSRECTPVFTMITSDKDDPRFDKYYIKGNELRLLIGLFLTDMPSYMSLGFETRNKHMKPAPNEYYSKLFVFQEKEGPKSTKGPYIWGSNTELFEKISKIRLKAEKILPKIIFDDVKWIKLPDPMGINKALVWTQMRNPKYLFVVNTDLKASIQNLELPLIKKKSKCILSEIFSTSPNRKRLEKLEFNENHYIIKKIFPAEGQIYFLLED